jgi:hypothetical protein
VHVLAVHLEGFIRVRFNFVHSWANYPGAFKVFEKVAQPVVVECPNFFSALELGAVLAD